jgi:hypothetical protein
MRPKRTNRHFIVRHASISAVTRFCLSCAVSADV